MDEVEPEKKKITLSVVVNYLFVTLFLLIGIIEIIIANYIAGILYILAAVITLQPSMEYIENKLNFSLSSAAKFFIVFCLVIGALAAVPHATPIPNNSTESTASLPSDVSSSETTASSSDGLVHVVATNYSCDGWSAGQYSAIKLFGEKYVSLKSTDASKLAKLVLDRGDKYTLKTGEKLDLGSGYALEAKQVDVDGNKVWFEFTKDGQYVDDQIVSADNDSSNTWTCELDNIQGEDNVPVLKVRTNQIFQGAVDSIAQIDGLWLVDYANAKTLKIGDKLGHFELVKINNDVDESNLGSLVFKPDGTQNDIQTAVPEITQTPDISKYQDEEWANSGSIQMKLITDDMSSVSNAAINYDIDDLQKYGAILATDSKSALDESKPYSVSPDLQPAKEKYETSLYNFNQAGYYATLGATELKSGNSDQATPDIKTATYYTNLGATNLNEAKVLLDDSNSKH